MHHDSWKPHSSDPGSLTGQDFFFLNTKPQFPHMYDTEVIVRSSGPMCLHLFHLMLQYKRITGVFLQTTAVCLSPAGLHTFPGTPPLPAAQIGSPSFHLSF